MSFLKPFLRRIKMGRSDPHVEGPVPVIPRKLTIDDIKFYEYSNFKNIEDIGEGAFGKVYSAYWETRGIQVALKTLNGKNDVEENEINNFIKELQLLKKVQYHPNINKIIGVTKDPNENKHTMILQYADGNLRQYLESKFDDLTFSDKIRIAQEIVKGLMCLHSENIVHRDLGQFMIADLGLSKDLDEKSDYSNPKVKGVIAYIEPLCLKNENYVRDMKSDIYSLGVILWEISSGKRPFSFIGNACIITKVLAGWRETEEPGTPKNYVRLYKRCWDQNPANRPTIFEVHSLLNSKEILANEDDDNNVVDLRSNKQEDKTYETDSISKEILVNEDEDDEDNNVGDLKSNKQEDKTYETDSISKSNSTQTKKKAESQSNSPLSLINIRKITCDKIPKLISEVTELHLSCMQNGSRNSWTKFSRWIYENQENSIKIFSKLFTDPDSPHKDILLGNFYEIGFGVPKDETKFFELYKKSSDKEYPYGHFEVGFCYENGYGGGSKNIDKAKDFYKKASDLGLNNAKYMLAMIYINDKEEKKQKEAFQLIKASAKGGYVPSQHYLSKCYRDGIGGKRKNTSKFAKWNKLCDENGGWE